MANAIRDSWVQAITRKYIQQIVSEAQHNGVVFQWSTDLYKVVRVCLAPLLPVFRSPFPALFSS